MKRYEFTLRPLSDFGTPIKGDTLFGCFCWQVAYDETLVEGGLEKALRNYNQNPFAVFSSAFLKIEINSDSSAYVLKRPDLPLAKLFPDQREGRKARYERLKELKRRRWMVVEKELAINLSDARFLNGEQMRRELGVGPVLTSSRPHNTINRSTFSTGTGAFAPYEMETFSYAPESNLAVIVLVNDRMTSAESVRTGLERIGKFGFGRDASIGMGRFEVVSHQEIPQERASRKQSIYTLGPCVPDFDKIGDTFFSPFIRFGKHGDRMAGQGLPFKNPVVMADEGAVFFSKPGTNFVEPYIGESVGGVSKAQETAVVQGYAPHIPITLE